MTLDIRLPLGLLFVTIGVLLLGFGLSAATPARAFGHININAVWGGVLMAFGLCMLLLARRHAARLRRRES